ncbi:BMP family ABC transporter substrate-binding protein [Candidatus Galacturonibacter soehngenii]|uniref:BMP family ABC transporter substrate-binding protein n=1 Tax=Candidatus Galacturonatibacter soehngenii TaxID=2307010 RepID=A0A7V7QP27_9FIRM|nr:BMP family ABC transporter substrate-binding protein [Candidatus Galacturonibacter soehngenii]KAB1440620.1 BMP family ABC transporter substrate-binding protein [Candidatus Galacturonibacter soehngenii]MBA4687882.1 BMP family ABC transporter substrate-binding protein [Candidatus Galacturonibacter soehngenii]
MKKRTLSLIVSLALTATLIAGCGSSATKESSSDTIQTQSSESASGDTQDDASAIKVGIMYIGDENEGYTESHMKGIQEMKTALGLTDEQVIEKTNIPEDESAYDAAVDLADQGCNIIFANSFGQESYMMQAAEEFPEVQFAHATGYQAASSGLSNMHNYFTSIYEARFVTGVVAGLKLNELIENGTITAEQAKIGYVGAFPYAEVVSGYTSFYLGAKSVCPTATMEVQYTNSWADMSGEAEVASQLIANGAKLISQHADTTGAPSACEQAGVPNVGYNVDMTSVAPDSALTSAYNNWAPYYTYAVKSVIDGTKMDVNWCQGFAEGAVGITALNEKVVAAGSAEKVAQVEAAIKDGSLHVFDTTTFTIGGKSLEDLIAEGGDYAKYADYVSDGYFHESELASSPSFDLRIDGITELTE